VVVNAAAALVAGGRARGFKEGGQQAEQSIDSGAAQRKLAALAEFSQKLAPAKT
jgi:anthranilate phosphoribosyltransferase